jgi:hypothetical protein
MSYHRYLPCLLTVSGMVLLAILLRDPAARWVRGAAGDTEPILSNLEKAPVDPAATELVGQLLARLSEPRLGWLQTDVWMKAHVPDLPFEGEGRYVRAPGQRYRMELRASLPGVRDEYTLVSIGDGRDVWTATRFGSGNWQEVRRLRLSTLLEAADSPAHLPQVRQELLNGPVLQGMDRLLRSLQGQVEWVRHEQRSGEVRLTGRWKPAVRVGLVEPKKPWPALVPHGCRLILQAPLESPWPGRLEWWGPLEDGGADHLLTEWGFRHPVFDRVLSADECAGLFAFDPGPAGVEDITTRIRAELDVRAKQLTLRNR